MTQLTIFNFDSSEVRTVTKDDEVWFVATDIAEILGYRNAPDMTRMLDDDEAATHIVRSRSENGVEQDREVTTISEPGLYRACFRSEKEAAKKLTRWVTHEVLPSIRKKGYYIAESKIKELQGQLALTNSRLNAVSRVKDPDKEIIELLMKQEHRNAVVRGHEAKEQIHEQFVSYTKRLLSQGVTGKTLVAALQNVTRWHDKTWDALFVKPGDFASTTFYSDMTY